MTAFLAAAAAQLPITPAQRRILLASRTGRIALVLVRAGLLLLLLDASVRVSLAEVTR